MKTILFLCVAALASTTLGTPSCKNLTIPVTISARNGKFAASLKPKTNIDVANFYLDVTRQGTNYTADVLEGYATISGTYNIAATYCAPSSGAPSVVQVLTHGVGFDRSYWNIPFNNYNYSYTNVAVDTYGFATFSYDRLGIGSSQHGDPLNFVQTPAQMAALEQLTKMLRAGSVKGVPKFSKVLHVGHSYGSIQTVGLLHVDPSLWDGVALTGFSPKREFLNFFELATDFIEAHSLISSYPLGYVAPGSKSANQLDLLAPNEFDPEMVDYLAATGVPPAVGEFLTLTAGNAASRPTAFKGPVIVVTGQYDLPFCGGNAYQTYEGYSSLPAASKKIFPDAKTYSTVIVPKSGHGLNLQYTHPYTYAQVNKFFMQNGLGP